MSNALPNQQFNLQLRTITHYHILCLERLKSLRSFKPTKLLRRTSSILIALQGASRNKMPIATATGIQSTKKTTRHTTKPVVPKPPRDADGFKNRAGCVVLSENKKSILLISSNGHKGKWILPAGTLELGEAPEDGAVRETLEEAGVVGEVQEKIGVFVDGKKNRTHYYALLTKQIVNDYEECEFRQRSWFSLREAEKELLWRPVQHQVLLTWMSRHSYNAVYTSATAGPGEKDIEASDKPQCKKTQERVIDDKELHKVVVEVKTGAS